MRYIGSAKKASIQILQQPNTAWRPSTVFKKDVEAGQEFTFASRRSPNGGIYAVNAFINGVSNAQYNSCCEFKYPKGNVKGDLAILAVTGLWNCQKCRVKGILKGVADSTKTINGPECIKAYSDSRNSLRKGELKVSKKVKKEKKKSFPVPPYRKGENAESLKTSKPCDPQSDSDGEISTTEQIASRNNIASPGYSESFASDTECSASGQCEEADNELTDDKQRIDIPFGIPMKLAEQSNGKWSRIRNRCYCVLLIYGFQCRPYFTGFWKYIINNKQFILRGRKQF